MVDFDQSPRDAGARVAIIGGGVIGAASAWFLRAAGHEVAVLDAGRFGAGCSHGNCGMVCPSHVLPLAEPGAVSQALGTLFRPGSPLVLRPQISSDFWAWLMAFARRCNERDMMEAGRANQPLLERSLHHYQTWQRDEQFTCQWHVNGLLFVYRDPEPMHAYAEVDRLLSEAFHLPARQFRGRELAEFEPSLRSDLAGGFWYEEDAQLRPDLLMRNLQQRLESRGVRIFEQTQVERVRTEGDRAVGLDTSRGFLPVDAVVLAAGMASKELAATLGYRAPLLAGKGYSLTLPPQAAGPHVPMILMQDRVAITPLDDGLRIGSTMELGATSPTIPPNRLRLLTSGAAKYFREPLQGEAGEQWFGLRPMTPDGKPLIGWLPGMRNVLLASGHGMLGLSMAPATGELVAQLIGGQPPAIDPRPYRLVR
jgi:D-amino-acid dehydrogenase